MTTVRLLLREVERRLGGWSSGARWSLVVGWFLFVSVLSHVPGTDVDATRSYLELLSLGELNVLARIAAHASVFGLEAVLIYVALGGSFAPSRQTYLSAVAGTAVLGLVDEVHQHFVPLRHGRLVDAGVDAVGGAIVLALVLGLFALSRSPERHQPVRR